MMQRVNSAQMLLEANVNCCNRDKATTTGVASVGCTDIRAEVKEEGRRLSGELILPSSTLSQWDSDMPMEIKPQQKKKKRTKVDKKAGTGEKTRNRKSSSGRTEKSAQSAIRCSSGRTTPDCVTPLQPVENSYLDEPLLQHQSQIFVFSTQLANEAAESVKCGRCKSIIHYHMEHPNTKQFLQNSNNCGCSLPVEMMKSQQVADMIHIAASSSAGWRPHTSDMQNSTMFDRSRMFPNGSYSSDPRAINGCPGDDPRRPHPQVHYPMNCRECVHNSMGCAHNSPDKFSIHGPDDNLTTEQKQHRSKGLAQLTKIHQMLMGDGSRHDGRQAYMGDNCHSPGSGMYSCRPNLSSLSHQPAMTSQRELMQPREMLSPHHQHMMMSSAHGCYPGQVPFQMNGKGQQQSAHDWYQAEREFLEKQQYPQNRGALMEPGAPPAYYSSISCKQSAMSEPSSPNMMGMGVLTHPHGSGEVLLPGMDADGATMYADGAGMYGGPTIYRPSHLEMNSMSRMHDYHSQNGPLQRPMVFECGSLLAREIPPGMGPGPDCSRPLRPVHKGHTVSYNEMLPDMKVSDEVTLHRAGNPEHFNPETMGGVVTPTTTQSSNSNKPPPSYAQAQKRKREEDKDDSYAKGNLQRTPSPTTIDYHLSQFEGQELTITKQLNSSFMDNKTENCNSEELSCNSLVSGNSECHFTGQVNSPSVALGSNKGSVHTSSSSTISAKPIYHQSQQEQANAHCTSFSPSAFSCGTNNKLSQSDSTDLNNGVNSGPHTTIEKSSPTTNITSATLANLAKGVEHLSSQMEQSMMEGGPFHSVQVQGEITGNSSSGNTGSHSSSSSANIYSTTAEPSSYSSYLSFHSGPTTSTQSSSALNINNTYMTTHSSVANNTSMNSYVDMQRQNINSESVQANIPLCGTQPSTGLDLESGMLLECSVSGISEHTNQFQGAANPMTPVLNGSHAIDLGPSGSSGLNPTGMFSSHQPNSSSCILATSPVLPKVQFTSSPLSNLRMNGSGSCAGSGVESPSVINTSSCNSSVQIQQKGHSTIQYLPAKPPSSQKSAATPKGAFGNKIPEFASLMHTADGKHSPSSQYFTNSSPAGPRSPMMPRALLAATALGPEFANQAAIAMHQSASMMRSSSMSDLDNINRNHPVAPLPKMGIMMPQNNPSQGRDPHLSGNNPLMGGSDPRMEMGSLCHMKSRSSPRSRLSLPQGMVPGNLECISPIADMEDCLSTGPSIEEAQAQAQAHAAMMMQENVQMSAHGQMVHRRDPSPHMLATGPMSGISMHPSMSHNGIPTSSALGSLMFGQYPYRPSLPIQSPHADMHRFMPCFSNEAMSNSVRSMFPHESLHRLSPQNFISGPLLPRMPVGYMHGLMPSGSLYRHPGMGHLSGQYGIHYPAYQDDFYCTGPQDHPQQLSGIMGSPRQPY